MHFAFKLLLDILAWGLVIATLIFLAIGYINLEFRSGRYFRYNGIIRAILLMMNHGHADILSFNPRRTKPKETKNENERISKQSDNRKNGQRLRTI